MVAACCRPFFFFGHVMCELALKGQHVTIGLSILRQSLAFLLENDLPPGVVLALESLCVLAGVESRRTFARKFADEWTRFSNKNCLIRHQRVSHDQFPSPEQRGRGILEHESVLNCVHLPSWYNNNLHIF